MLSSVENFLKYLLAVAEHGSIKYVTVNRELTVAELETYFSSYPFLLDNKYGLICSPYPTPTNCRLESPDMGISCEKPLYMRSATCYDMVTGELYSKSTSEKIFEMLSKAHRTCALRFTLDVKKKFAPPTVSSVPPQANPVPPKEEEEKTVEDDVNKLFKIVNELKTKYGTPPTTPPPKPPKKTTPPEKKFKMCFELANDFGFPEMKEAIASRNKEKAMSVLHAIADSVLSREDALIDYTEYGRRIKLCQRELDEL